MINLKELFKGVAVIIDDEINDPKANINNLLNQIITQKIPYLLYEKIPTPESIQHFQNLSFLLLDWEIITEKLRKSKKEGIKIPQQIIKSYEMDNIDFIKQLKKVCFCPIFIFTNEFAEDIEKTLEENGLFKQDQPVHIFVKLKNELKGKSKLFNEIEKWTKKNPSIYVLKEWEQEYQKSKNKLFDEFQDLSPYWPKIMWKNFGRDGVNKSLELGELISRNLHNRMTPFEFSDDILGKRNPKIEKNELRKVMEGERFLKEDNLDDTDISPGDVFKISSKYFLNIRAVCDLVPDRSDPNSSIDDVDLYLLKGSKISDTKSKKLFHKDYGQFSEIDSQSIVFPIDDSKVIDFRFKNLEKKNWKELKNNRIGRLLPPYINKIQQRYALYFQREGLPRIPDAAI